MNDNPFISKTFIDVWLKYFYNGKKAFVFNSINGVQFIKHKYISLYINVGKNITNGIYYILNDSNVNDYDYKGKVFLIHDVPEYFKVDTSVKSLDLKIYKIRQYKGYLTNLSRYKIFDAFLNDQFRSKRRNYLKKKQEQLEVCFDVKYSFFYGEVDKETYTEKMKVFSELLTKRFDSLGLANDILSNWDYYEELIYKMILQKKALLFAIQCNDRPIGIAFCFLSNNILFYATPTFDTDYIRFNLGHTTIIELQKWCFRNKIAIYDLSKGEYDYKKRWANEEYNFQTHVIYHSKSLKAVLLGSYLRSYFFLKQYLRDKKVNLLYTKFKYFFKAHTSIEPKKRSFQVIQNIENLNINKYNIIDFESKKYRFLNLLIIENLSINPEPIKNIKVYVDPADDLKQYYVVGEKNNYKIIFN